MMLRVLLILCTFWPAVQSGLSTDGPLIDGMSQSGSKELEAGQTLRLVCSFNSPIKWILPNNSMFAGYSNPSTDGRHYENGLLQPDGSKYEAVLEIGDLSYTDTGRYLCQSEEATLFKNLDTPAKPQSNNVYIFVVDNKAEDLFLKYKDNGPSYGKNFVVSTNVISTVGCKVSNPEAKVSLFIADKHENLEQYYNPQSGFVLPKYTHLNNARRGQMTRAQCRGSTSDGRSDTLDILIFYIVDQEKPIEVTVNATGAHNAYKGGQMTIDCRAKKGLDPQQLKMALFDWEFPAVDEIVDDPNGRVVKRVTPYAQSSLTIKDLKISDSGQYKCTCSYLGRVNSSEMDVSVSPTKGQVHVLHHSDPVVVADGKDMVLLTAELQIYPEPTQAQIAQSIGWILEQNDPLLGVLPAKRITNGKDIFISTQMKTDSGTPDYGRMHFETGLNMKNLVPAFSGVYKIWISVGGDFNGSAVSYQLDVLNSSLNSKLLVTESTNTSHLLNPRFLQKDTKYTLACVTEGKPYANVQIGYKPCLKAESCGDFLSLDASNRIQGTYSQADTVELEPDRSGTYRCVASRGEEQPALTETELIITDVQNSEENEGMAVTHVHFPAGNDGKEERFYEKDGLVLICAVQKYDYSFVSWHLDTGDGVDQTLGTAHETQRGYNITYEQQSPYSNRLVLRFGHLSTHDNGTYFCQAQRDGQQVTRSIKLEVTPVFKPALVASATSPQKVEVNYTHGVQLRCSATGSPTPVLKWLKDKRPFVTLPPRFSLDKSGEKMNISAVVPEDAGVYTCVFENRVGILFRNITLTVVGGPQKPALSDTAIWVLCTSLVLAFFIVIVLFGLLIYQKRKDRVRTAMLKELYEELMSTAGEGGTFKGSKLDPNRPVNRQAENLPYDRRFELAKDLLILEKLVGEGQFGKVWKGTLAAHADKKSSQQGHLPVAVKVPLNGRSLRDQKALLDELKIMIHIGQHVNVLGLVGAITKFMVKGELYVVVELCELGSVLDYIKQHRVTFINEIVSAESPRPAVAQDGYFTPNRFTETESSEDTTRYQAECDPNWAEQLDQNRKGRTVLSSSDLLSYSYQAANGMDFLAKKTMIHRDLAARNLLLTRHQIVKIADFGLARQDETYHIQTSKNVPLPIKWMALESILDQDFTVKSDIWSFGVVLWELFALGETPYPTQPLDPSFVTFLKNGNRLEQPNYSPVEIYHLMRQCWLVSTTDRPDFDECREKIGQQLQRCSAQLFESVNQTLAVDEEQRINDYVNWRPSLIETQDSESQAAQYLNSPRYRDNLPTSPPPEVENKGYMMSDMTATRGPTVV